jgi:hypothetical protein
VQKQDTSVVDDIIADIKQMLDSKSEDVGTEEEVGTTDTGGDDAVDEDAAVVDATIDDAVDEDAAVADATTDDAVDEDVTIADAGEECVSSCYQPTGVACDSSLDCEKYLPGKCAGSDQDCTPETKCEGGAECKGSFKVTAQVNPDTGETSPWSAVNCIEGECHEGQAAQNMMADKCCATAWENVCEDTVVGGCNPWGPPAPPAFGEVLA